MRILKFNTFSLKRTRLVTLAATATLAFTALTSHVVQAQEEVIFKAPEFSVPQYTGSYVWQTQKFDKYLRSDSSQGYVEQYTNDQKFCNSPLVPSGAYLMQGGTLGIALLLLVLYLFIGIAVLSDVLLAAVGEITTATESVEIRDKANEKSIWIAEPVWNSQIANVTLLALGSSAPEIFLCLFSMLKDIEGVPNQIGPIVLVGSGAFNLLVVSALSIMAATETKRVLNLCSFLTTAAFATVAYVWLFVVLLVISPGVVDFSEAMITLLGYPMLILVIWISDKITDSGISDEEQNKKRICKHGLRTLAHEYGLAYVLDINRINAPATSTEEMKRIQEYFKVCLGVEDLSNVTLEELAEVLEPENPISRLTHRKSAQLSVMKPFGTASGSGIKHKSIQRNSFVGFKHSHYTVCEEAGVVKVTIVKRIQEDYSFYISTVDDTAKSTENFTPIRQLLTMKAHEAEREVSIMITNSLVSIHDMNFKVVLLEEGERKQLQGIDSQAIVTILDDDSRSFVGFKQPVFKAGIQDGKVIVTLKRFNGADGEATVALKTLQAHPQKDIGDLAEAGVHFKALEKNFQITFEDFQTEANFEIELMEKPEENQKLSFTVQMKNTKSRGDVIISKRNTCVVELDSKIDTDSLQTLGIMNHFIKEREQTWSNQFKRAIKMQPTIDEYDNIKPPTYRECFIHFLTLPWKILFACIPPKHICGGWVSFGFAFALIGVLSFVILEVMSTMGCLLNLKPALQALTLVAIATSVPDAFTSYKASADPKTPADVAICNITASNAANIFIGLGLPWTIATVYHWSKNGDSYLIGKYETAEIAFILALFLLASVIAILILLLRRVASGGELGGPSFSKGFSACVLVTMWIIFVCLSSFHAYGKVGPFEIFEPDVSMNAAQVSLGPTISSPPQVSAFDEGIQISWNLPLNRISRRLSATPESHGRRLADAETIDQVEVEVLMPNSQFSGSSQRNSNDWRQIKPQCDATALLKQGLSSCKLMHSLLHYDYGFNTCSQIQVRVRMHNQNGWSDWSSIGSGNARVKGLPQNFQLQKSTVTESSITLNVLETYIDPSDAECTITEYHVLDQKQPGSAWSALISETSKQMIKDYEVTGLQSCTPYLFRARPIDTRYCNEPVCKGPFTSPPFLVTTSCPGTPQLASVKGRYMDCENIQLQWQMPSNSLNPIQSYTVQARAKGGTFFDIPGCATVNTQCIVPLSTLSNSATFGLGQGDAITVRVRAINNRGALGDWSPFNSDGLAFYQGALTIGQPEIFAQDTDSVWLKWQPRYQDGSPLKNQIRATYDMQVSQNGNTYTNLLSETTLTSYVVQNLAQGGAYTFQIRVNSCGQTSNWVTSKEFRLRTVPGQVLNVGAEIQSCSFIVSWQPPSGSFSSVGVNSGSTVDKYVVEVRDRVVSNSYIDLGTQCTKISQYKCSIQLANFKRYGFVTNDQVFFRVTARNKAGSLGLPSQSSNPVQMQLQASLPAVGVLSYTSDNNDQVTISWTDVLSGMNRVDDLGYQLFWGAQGGSMGNEVRTQGAYATIQTLGFSGNYEVKVRTINNCTVGQQSPIMVLNTGNPAPPAVIKPSRMAPPDVSVDMCTVIIAWRPVNTSNVIINKYLVEVAGADGIFYTVSSCGTSAGTTGCSIALNFLTQGSPFFLREGMRIQARVSAISSQATSDVSDVGQSRQTISNQSLEIPQPTIDEQNNNSVRFRWRKVFTNDVSTNVYDIFEDKGSGFQLIQVQSGNTYFKNNLANATQYRYQVRARSNNCEGTLSPEIAFRTTGQGQKPVQVATVTTTLEASCYVKISWSVPMSGSVITGYDVQIKATGVQKLNQHCNSNPCSIPIHILTGYPYSLQMNSLIQVSVAANNQWGQGKPSEWNTTGARVLTKPRSISQFTYTATNTSITLQWPKAPSSFNDQRQVTYEVWEKNNGFWALKQEVYGLSYTKSSIFEHGNFLFRIRAKNSCGVGPWSNEQSIAAGSKIVVPGQMSQVTTSSLGCSVRINWQTPAITGGRQIQKYRIEVRAQDQTFHPLTSYCGGDSSTSCTVPMSSLTNYPYNLRKGDLIVIRGAAYNEKGYGNPSTLNIAGARMLDVPNVVPVVAFVKRTARTIQISWTKVLNNSQVGSYYEVQWDNGTVNNFRPAAPELSPSISTFTVRDMIVANMDYRFRVKAYNQCGSGTFSNVLIVQQGEKARQPAPVTTIVDGCNIRIGWTQPSQSQAIIRQQVSVVISPTATRVLPECGRTLTERTCTVPIHDLKTKYGLPEGQLILFQVQAENSNGWGKPSEANTSGARLSHNIPTVAGIPNLIKNGAGGYLTWQGTVGMQYEVFWMRTGTTYQLLKTVNTPYLSIPTTFFNVPGATYKFKVRAVVCGQRGAHSDDSNDLLHSSAPGTMQPLSIVSGPTCGIKINWRPPPNSGSPITRYIVQVKTGTNTMGQSSFLSTNILCGENPSIPSCVIDKAVLMKDPFNLKVGESFFAKIAAVNSKGRGTFSAVNPDTGIKILTPPEVMQPPRLNKTLFSTPGATNRTYKVTISWDPLTGNQMGGSPIQLYKLFWNQGILNKSTDMLLAEGVISSYTYPGAVSDAELKKPFAYSVQAVNACGPGRESDQYNHVDKDSPKKMKPVVTYELNCKTRITWVPPPHTEFENVQSYKLEILTSDSVWEIIPLKICGEKLGQERETSCDVNLDFLSAAPYNIKENTVLIARVQAKNRFGYGPPSDSNVIGARVLGRPSKMTTLQATQKVVDQTVTIILNWRDEFVGRNYVYELWWDNGRTGKYVKIKETIKTQATVEIKIRGGTYRFRIRAKSMCHTGPFSEDVQVDSKQIALKPGAPQEVQIKKIPSCGGITIAWKEPIDIQIPVQAYSMQIKTKKRGLRGQDIFSSDNIVCKAETPTQCSVTQAVLMAAPYSFIPGDLIYARVIAYNEFGWGLPSPVNTKDYQMHTTRPGKMSKPKLFMKHSDTAGEGIDVKISWDEMTGNVATGGQKILQYDVIWDEGSLNQVKNADGTIPEAPMEKLKRLKETSSPYLMLEKLKASQIYRFRVRARNECGYGDYSDEGAIELAMVPDQMGTVRTSFSQGRCEVVISWVPPNTHGKDIERYYIQVINPRATWNEKQRSKPGKDCYNCLSKCGETGREQFCVVPMSRLLGPPFNLKMDDEIIIQASAQNAMGIARIPSPSNVNSVKMVQRPNEMQEPIKVAHMRDSVSLKWPALIGSQTGGRPIQSYNLFWDNGQGSTDFTAAGAGESLKYQLLDQLITNYKVQSLQQQTKYRFKVRARNACGYGLFSQFVEFETAGCPLAPEKPAIVLLVNTDVEISWQAPVTRPGDAELPVTEYDIRFKTQSGTYVPEGGQVMRYCNGKDARIIKNRKCDIPMREIPGLTGQVAGDLIVVQVRARNKYCVGAYTKENDVGQHVLTCPLKMKVPTSKQDEVFKNSITIRWENLKWAQIGGPGLKVKTFEVQIKPQAKTTWKKRYIWRTQNLRFTFTRTKYDQSYECYSFRLRAWNKFCFGQWSDPINVCVGQVPNTPLKPVTSIVARTPSLKWGQCDPTYQVAIKWKKPVTNAKLNNYYYIVQIGTFEEIKPVTPKVVVATAGSAPTGKAAVAVIKPKVYTYKTDKSICDGKSTGAAEETCLIPMSTFWKGTFGLPQGTLITAKVKCCNRKGCSKFSKISTGSALVHTVPQPPAKITGSRSRKVNEITLNWTAQLTNTGGSSVTAYELQSKYFTSQTVTTAWKSLVGLNPPSKAITFVHRPTDNTNKIQYQVRTKNRWGCSDYNWPVFEIGPGLPPGIVNTPSSTIDPETGKLKVEWEMVDVDNPNALMITDYVVQFKDASNNWRITKQCQVKMNTIFKSSLAKQHLYCNIQMLEIIGSGGRFRLPFDSLVQIRISAVNYACKTSIQAGCKHYQTNRVEWSSVNTEGARVRQLPGKVPMPTVEIQGRQQKFINVQWQYMTRPLETGNSIITEYQIEQEIFQPSGTAQAGQNFVNKYTGNNNYYVEWQTQQGPEYRYRVRAKNIYGLGPWSDTLIVPTGTVPDTPQSIRSINPVDISGVTDVKQIQIFWDAPQDNGAKIMRYTIQLYVKRQGKFQEDISLCDGRSATVITNRQCTISSATLAGASYGYRSGDMFVAKVSATNSYGEGKFSMPNTTGGTVFRLMVFNTGGA